MQKLYNHLDHISRSSRLSRDDKSELQTLFEDIYPVLEGHNVPKGFRLATGEIARVFSRKYSRKYADWAMRFVG